MGSRTLAGGLALKGDWTFGEDHWDDEMDANLLRLSVLCQGRVVDIVSVTPGAPAEGAVYLFASDHPTQPNKVAARDNGAWVYFTPLQGWRFYNVALGASMSFSGAAWVTDGASANAATVAQAWAGTNNGAFMTPKTIFDMAAPVALPAAAANVITPDFGAGINFYGVLVNNVTLANPTNAKPGQSGKIKLTQDATGSRTLAYGNKWRFPGGAATGGVLSTAGNSVDHLTYFVEEDGTITAAVIKALAA